jgi:hypothetical protein
MSDQATMKEPMVMMAVEHYASYRWVQAPVAALALWLISSPFTFGYRGRALIWSDIVSGVLTLAMAFAALGRRRGLVSWLIAVIGLWLLFAPLLFWAPQASAYANDTLVGALLIAFAFIIPMGMTMKGAEVPPGWSYNPSSWPQRAPVILLAFVSFLVARYMAAYQLGYTDRVWDPFFVQGSERVLHSEVSKAWPVSDAGLGALTYMIEVLMGLMGGPRRWRTMPWMVAGFGFVVVPLGVVSIALVIMQPVLVGAWCSGCLLTAAAMLLMIPLSLDEVVAMLQIIVQKRREGQSAWRVFWLGAHLPESAAPESSEPAGWSSRSMFRGFTGAWNLWLCLAVGVWLMCAPAAFGLSIEAAAADSDHIVGALVVVLSVIALAEVARPVRFLNVLAALWLVLSPWFLSGRTGGSMWNDALMGSALGWLSLPLGNLRDHYGSFDRVVVFNPWSRHLPPQRHWRPKHDARAS